MAARTEMRQAPGGRGGKKDPNGLTLGVTGLSFSCMDLVDPKRDFLLTLNESAQSQIAACNLGGLRGERRPRSLHNRCYCYFFFFCRTGALGDAQTCHTLATRQKPKYSCRAQKFL